jgi:hypothetical protein
VTGGSRSTRDGQVSARVATWVAWSWCGLTLALLAATVLVLLAGRPPASAAGNAWQRQAADLVSLVGAPLLGGLIAARRPDNRYGWLWLAFGLGLAVTAFASAYAAVALTSGPDGLPGLAMAGWLEGIAFTVVTILFPFLFLLFPNGRHPSPRWRLLAWAIVVVGALTLIGVAFTPETAAEGVANPFGVGGWLGGVLGSVVDPGIGLLFLALPLSALSLLLRLRRARGVERQQLKWFTYAAALVGAFIISDALGLVGPGLVNLLLTTLTLTGVYVGIGIAVLRYRLYEIDRIINRTLVYALLTLVLGLCYVAGALVFVLVAGAGTDPPSWLIAAATLVAAGVFRPARRRIQAVADRRFNRRKYNAAQTIQAFSTRLREQVDLDTLSTELLAVVDQTMEPTRVSLWLRPSAAGSSGTPGSEARPATWAY